MNTIPYAAIRRNIMETPPGSYRSRQLRQLDAIQKARLPARAEIRVYDKQHPVKAVLICNGKRTTGKRIEEESSWEYYKATAIRDIMEKTPWLMKQYVAGKMEIYRAYGQTPARIPDLGETTVKNIMYYLSDAYTIAQYRDQGDKNCEVYLLNKK